MSKKLFTAMMALVMMCSLTVFASADEPMLIAAAPDDEIVIIHTNDVHCGYEAYDKVAALAKDADLLVDAGDAIQGGVIGTLSKGEYIVDIMNYLEYDLATLGNHEFDYGMDRLLELIETKAEYPYVAANFTSTITGKSYFDAYKIFEVNGTKIAFVGIATPESFTKSTPAYFQDENGNYIYGIGGSSLPLHMFVQDAIYAAQSEGAEIIIALGHLGDDPASQPWTSEEVIAKTTGLHAFIDGHSHSTVPSKVVKDKGGNDVILTQTGEYFGAIGKMTISADGSIATELLTEWAGSDEDVKAIKDDWMTEIDTQLGQVIGHLDVTLDNYDADGKRLVRKMETNTGDFAADALYYLFDNMGLDVDVAIMNGGGVRNKAVTGDFSYKTAKEIHTFGNVACLQTISGQQLLDALEWGARGTDTEEIGGFLHVSGITYEINTMIPSTVQMDEKGVWVGGPTGAYRVQNVQILQNGAYVDLDLDAKYNLAGYNYTLRDLGDGFAMFDGAVNVLDYVMEDYMVLANYIKSFPVDEETGLPTVTAENSPYGDLYGDGRIKLVKGFTDVPAGAFFFDPVQWAVENGITTGTSATTFTPDRDVTRAEVVTFLWRANGSPVVTSDKSFSDVKESDFFYNAVIWAAEEGITTGKDNGLFDPFGTCTRAEALTFLWRSEDTPACEQGTVNSFVDVYADDFFAPAVMWAISESITSGVDATHFAPYSICNRAHIVTFLFRAAAA